MCRRTLLSVVFLCCSVVAFSQIQPIPYCEDFESYGAYPTTWYQLVNWDNATSPSLAYDYWNMHSGAYALELFTRNYENTYTIAITPRLEATASGGLYICFYGKGSSANTSIIVGYMTDPSSASSFEPIDTVTVSVPNDWEYFQIFTNAPVGNNYVAFKMLTSDSRSFWIDDLLISKCLMPDFDQISFANITSTSVQVTGATNDNFLIEWGTHGFAQGTGSFSGSTNGTLTISDLAENTIYDAYIYAVCDSTPLCEKLFHFRTYKESCCNKYNDMAYSNIDSLYAHGWSLLPLLRNDLYYYYPDSYYEEPVSLFIQQGTLVSPYVSHPQGTMIHFKAQGSGTVGVGYMVHPEREDSYVQLQSFTLPNNNYWETFTLNLTGVPDSAHYIAIRSNSGYPFYCHLEDVVISDCFAYISRIDSVAPGAVSVQWVGNAPSVEITHQPYQGVVVRDTASVSSVTISGLANNQYYEFNIQALCPSDTCGCDYCNCSPILAAEGFAFLTPEPLRPNLCYEFDNGDLHGSYRYWYHRMKPFPYDFSPRQDTTTYFSPNTSLQYSVRGFNTHSAVFPKINPQNYAFQDLYLTFTFKGNIGLGYISDYNHYNETFHTLNNYGSGNIWRAMARQFSSEWDARNLLTFYLESTGNYLNSHIDNIAIRPCAALNATFINTTAYSSELHWSGGGNASYYTVEYGPSGFQPGTGTIVTTHHDSIVLHNLNASTSYVAYIYAHCSDDADTVWECPSATAQTNTLPGTMSPPICEDYSGWESPLWEPMSSYSWSYDYFYSADKCIQLNNNGIVNTVIAQIEQNVPLYLSFCASGPTTEDHIDSSMIVIGFYRNGDNFSDYIPIDTVFVHDEWERFCLTIPTDTCYGDRCRFSIRNNSSIMPRHIFIDDISLNQCAISNVKTSYTQDGNVQLSWHVYGNASVHIEYGLLDFERGHGTLLHTTDSSIIITGLENLEYYDFYVWSTCQDSLDNCGFPEKILVIVANIDRCINYVNIRDEQVNCTIGHYTNPFQRKRVRDYGYNKATSRHTIYSNFGEYDPRTANQLRCIPDGEEASVRIGNWLSGAGAESITYDYVVDDEQDILVLKYAAVLQNPDHTAADQPIFVLQILDDNMELVDSVCATAYFIADSSLGWNIVNSADGQTLWKDWTTVGVDMSAYHNQNVYVRLITYDCREGAHYGYAYFTLNCASRLIDVSSCSPGLQDTLTAPAGFFYEWYHENDPATILGRSQQLMVITDSTSTYYCDVIFTGDSSCRFTLSAYAGIRRPHAVCGPEYFTCHIEDCHYVVDFTQDSYITVGFDNPTAEDSICDLFYWDFGNGTYSYSDYPSVIYDHPGTYTVTLVVGTTEWRCSDTVSFQITLDATAPAYERHVYDTLCQHHKYNRYGFNLPENDDVGDFEYRRTIPTGEICDSIYILHIHIVPDSLSILLIGEDFCENYSAVLQAVSGMPHYTWSTGEHTTEITVEEPGSYTVTASDEYCVVSSLYRIAPCEINLFFPNAITGSNDDGLNQYFSAFGTLNLLTDFEILIYNRWGEIIYKSKDPHFKWYGTCGNRYYRNTIYNYICTYTSRTGRHFLKKGSVVTL